MVKRYCRHSLGMVLEHCKRLAPTSVENSSSAIPATCSYYPTVCTHLQVSHTWLCQFAAARVVHLSLRCVTIEPRHFACSPSDYNRHSIDASILVASQLALILACARHFKYR